MRKARESQILELLSQCGRMEVSVLAQRLGVSQVTVRKDLDALEGKWGLPLLRAFLSTDFHFLDVPGFFAVRPDDPLAVFRTTMEEPALFQAGLIPPGWGEDAAGVAGVCAHPAGVEEGGLDVVCVLEVDGGFFVEVAVEDAAEEPCEGSVVAVDDFHFGSSDLVGAYKAPLVFFLRIDTCFIDGPGLCPGPVCLFLLFWGRFIWMNLPQNGKEQFL